MFWGCRWCRPHLKLNCYLSMSLDETVYYMLSVLRAWKCRLFQHNAVTTPWVRRSKLSSPRPTVYNGSSLNLIQSHRLLRLVIPKGLHSVPTYFRFIVLSIHDLYLILDTAYDLIIVLLNFWCDPQLIIRWTTQHQTRSPRRTGTRWRQKWRKKYVHVPMINVCHSEPSDVLLLNVICVLVIRICWFLGLRKTFSGCCDPSTHDDNP